MFAMKEKKKHQAQHKTIIAIKYAARTHKLRLCQGDSMFLRSICDGGMELACEGG